ncbi:hypothetical protein WOLCODRAFT_83470 [Wolfiporia cocos MD-104 SS10]|uniref:Uncharacterized protein n=1 Tax=Wolfiporia cocos (strain MD-104) TaxID=742152 RepID=A0A2H3JKL3_WOLCO|nr:hypothetical protein WOLCODRAFT_83470 [Wolfiporia cocos MD-104 SS10]
MASICFGYYGTSPKVEVESITSSIVSKTEALVLPFDLICIAGYVGSDFPMTLPLAPGDLDSVSLTVEESVHFPLEGAASDQQWFGLTSAGSGYIRLGLDQRLFMVTMFHELHCLRVLNFAYGGSDAANEEHITHCLGYLRQMALCAADTTLEPDDFTTRDFEVDRMGSMHTCRDWSTVYGVMQDGYDGWMNAGGE